MNLESMARELGALLKERGETVAVSESSTGGLVSAALLSIPGASAYFVGGAVVYTGDARQGLLGLPATLPDETRSSSEPYAALGARDDPRASRDDVGARRDRGDGPDRQPLRRRGGAHLPRRVRTGRARPHPRDRARRPRSQHVGVHPSRPRAARRGDPPSVRFNRRTLSPSRFPGDFQTIWFSLSNDEICVIFSLRKGE